MEIKKREALDALIERRWGTSITLPKPTNRQDWGEYDDEMEKARIISNIEDTVDAKGKLISQQPAYNRPNI